MKKCINCYRCREDWRNAKEKGLKIQQSGLFEYSIKPRDGVRKIGVGWKCPDEIEDHKACKDYESRLIYNLKCLKTRTHFELQKMYRKIILVPLGSFRKPVDILWKDSYGCLAPECPHCGEMPYSLEQCVFCGQKFSKVDI